MVEDRFGIVGSSIAGAFHVEAVVAEGGFSVVYRAQHQGFNAPVALKCLKLPEKLSAERQKRFLAQFRAEGELLFALSASISTVVRPLHIDALTTPDGSFVPYMVLEWLDGETLDVMLERRGGALPIKKLVRLLTPVAEALAKAHDFHGNQGSVSIVHCDVKPENIFIARVGDEEVVKILDFGVSKAQSVASQVAGKPPGQRAPSWFTPAFAAPEQWAPDRLGDVGPWTDVWGLALTLVESLKGSAVLEGEPMEIRALALDPARRPTPMSLGIAVEPAVEKVFVRALAVDPRERPRDAREFWDELTAALGMRDGRPRDARREAGSVPREEVIEAARPPPPPRPSGKAMPLYAPPGVMRPAGMTRATLGIDDPFGDAEPLDDGLDDGRSSLEAALPSIPPGGLGGEAMLPSLPPEAPVGGEAALPSLPPEAQGVGFAREASLPSIPPQDQGRGGPLQEPGFDFTLAEPPPGRPVRLAPEPRDLLPAPLPEAGEAALTPPPGLKLQLDVPEPAPAAGPRRGLELERTSSPSAPRAQHVLKPRVMESEPEQARRPLPLFPVGLGLVVAAISVGAAGRVYHGQTGQALALGPVSATPIAAVLLVAGLGLIVFHLLPKDN